MEKGEDGRRWQLADSSYARAAMRKRKGVAVKGVEEEEEVPRAKHALQ